MKFKIFINDLKNNKLLSFSTWIFMGVSALLFALTVFVFVNLLGSINGLMEQAGTPDFLQMHAGAADKEKIIRFATENDMVENYQILTFLNMENGSFLLNGNSLADSTQDNGLCIQSQAFDYLLDTKNQIIQVKKGELYVPVCYQTEYGLEAGKRAQIGEEEFIIAGFLRDSQMNSMMASSKRFLVSEEDYKKLVPSGSEEYLIEFLLKDSADTNAFAAAYAAAGLPMNGPTITRSLIRMMNALSDGMMVLVIMLVSVVMLLISILCIRFTLLERIETDKKEIGMLKAVGIPKKELRRIYFSRYLLLSAAGAVSGLVIALFGRGTLEEGMERLYGPPQNTFISLLSALLAVTVTQGFILLSILRTLKKMEGMSAVEALTDRMGKTKQHPDFAQNLLIVFVIVAGVFLMVVPQNLYSTIASPKFVTYMGIGEGEIRVDIRQTEDILAKTRQVEKLFETDEQVEKQTTLLTKSYSATLPDGSSGKLQVEEGDHLAFPVNYTAGEAPTKENELALSCLCAQEWEAEVGDRIQLKVDGRGKEFLICGIYSDITNGGKTAKAAYISDAEPVMWSILYVGLKENVSREQWISRYETTFSEKDISARVVNIRDYVAATYGQTMNQIQLASGLAVLAAIVIMVTVVFLFLRLLMAKDRNEISLQKALGLTAKEIMGLYGKKYLLLATIGILTGVFLGNVPGESLAGILLQSLGASGIHFITNRFMVYLLIPAVAFVTVLAAVLMGLWKIRQIGAWECCRGRE